MTATEALVLPISSGCVLHEHFLSAFWEDPDPARPILSDPVKHALTNVFVTLPPDPLILR
jgi:hypothetical protein